MENTHENEQQETAPEKEGYAPRPLWQVWGARIALTIFLLLVIVQIVSIARGGR